MKTAFLVATAALVLAACSQEAGNADGDTTALEADRAVAGETAAETVLGSEGYGPLRIGMTLDEVTGAMGGKSDPDAVGGPEPELCEEFRPERAPEGLFVMIEDGRLSRITLAAGSVVTTDEQLRVGSDADAVRQAYGDAITALPHKYVEAPGEYLTFWKGGVRPESYIEDEAARGIRYEIGQDGTVDYIHAGGPSIQYVEGCL